MSSNIHRSRLWHYVPLLLSLLVSLLSSKALYAQVVSPGKLSRAHAALEGARRCSDCHGLRGRVEPVRCFACHKVLDERIKKHRGYHARLGQDRCGECHQEHQGRSFDIVRWPGGKDSLQHERMGYALGDAHAKQECRDCHKAAFQTSAKVKQFDTARRGRTYLGLDKACKSCHEDEHEGRLGNICQDCHTERTFEKAKKFSHNMSDFKLRGAHTDVGCDDCHRQAGRKPEVRFKGLAFSSCGDCHKDKHKGAMDSKHKANRCKDCHTNTAWKDLTYKRSLHSPKQLPLTKGHAKAPCSSCHGEKIDQRPKSSCASCHQDVHQGSFGTSCERCHTAGDWRARIRSTGKVPAKQMRSATRLGLPRKVVARSVFHSKTSFPLEGLHMKVACKACHSAKKRKYRKRFKNIAHSSCEDCHEDEHEGQFGASSCQGCHSTDGWPLTSYDVERHKNANLKLEDAHLAVSCDHCHSKQRPKAQRFRFKTTLCADCHKDPHSGQFDKQPDLAHPAQDCDACHSKQSFALVYFDHNRTPFALRQAHSETTCSSCHQKQPSGLVQYRGTPQECSACHQDKHMGQFRLRGSIRSCDSCHSQRSFAIANFDHSNRTNEVLAGAHSEVDCALCHHKVKLQDGKRVALYRLGPRECVDCHKEQHAQKAERLRIPRTRRLSDLVRKRRPKAIATSDCQACHTAARWQSVKDSVRFDHAAVGYALRGEHSGLDCSQCHNSKSKLGRECSVCHQDKHNGNLGMMCAECHQESAWLTTGIRDQHRQSRLPLTGRHALVDCTSCHPQERQGQFRAIPAACVNCHASEYTDASTHPNHMANGFGPECQDCHRPYGWSPAYFVHNIFRLEGAHRKLRCNLCHDAGPAPQPICSSCHTEDAQVQFPSHGGGGFTDECDTCHGQSTWQPASYRQHDADSGFRISRGDHSGFDCADCHDNSATATCTTSCHPRGKMDDEHDDERDYMYLSSSCLACHPDGKD